jgi:hypothetical protein
MKLLILLSVESTSKTLAGPAGSGALWSKASPAGTSGAGLSGGEALVQIQMDGSLRW